jgi:hypothetical protein
MSTPRAVILSEVMECVGGEESRSMKSRERMPKVLEMKWRTNFG